MSYLLHLSESLKIVSEDDVCLTARVAEVCSCSEGFAVKRKGTVSYILRQASGACLRIG